jgi:E3 ubiquitin-protein ligase TRIP12
VGRLQRHKVRVYRNRILESAVKVLEQHCAQPKAVLEVEYFGEVGTGLGPTLEFFTLVSHELQNRKLRLWREDDTTAAAADEATTQLVTAAGGLFPAPLSPAAAVTEAGVRTVERFRLLGRLLGKALQDWRLMDLTLAPALYRLLQGRRLGLPDVCELEPSLGKILTDLQALCVRKAALVADGATKEQLEQQLTLQGCPVEALAMDFTLPGYPSYELQVCENASSRASLFNASTRPGRPRLALTSRRRPRVKFQGRD